MDEETLVRKRKKAQRDGNVQVLADIQKKLGDLYFDKKQHSDALKAYKGQLEACEILNNRLNCAIAHRMIGEVYADFGRFNEALHHQNLYLELAQQLENLIEEQRAYATLGRTYLLIADSFTKNTEKEEKKRALKDAKGAFTESIKLCEKLEKKIDVAELMTMRARLLLNLGLVLEQQKKTEKALEYLTKATSLCKKHNLNDDLHRTNIALAGLNERLGDTELALQYLSDACNVNDIYLKADAQLSKAELVLKLGDWVEARRILYKMYKSKQLLDSVRQQVERFLKIAVVLCRTEDRLLTESNAQRKAKLYERMGDAATAVRSLDRALTFYERMLESAEQANDGPSISGALTSIAQTLRDSGRPGDALPYARRELQNASTPKDEANSALYLAALLEDTNADPTELSETLNRAVMAAERSGDEKLLRNVLMERLEYPGDKLEIEEAKRRLEKLPEEVEEKDDEEEVEESQEIGADVGLSDLSDELEDEDPEVRARNVARTLTKKRKCVMKKNEKGETQLHVACIKGNVTQVERLLEEGHPTGPRDNCGWTPLHEAANHGHVEICQMLLKAGADANDPGGSGCDGVTALHDAASNGNAPVIQLLLDAGAKPNLLTRAGDCALCCLLKWRDRVEDISQAQELEYEAARSRMAALTSHKCRRKESSKKKYSALLDDDDEVEPAKHGRTLDDWTTPDVPEPERISAGEDYKRTIAALQHPGRALKQAATSRRAAAQPKITAPLLDSEEVLADNWLEDDLGDQAPGKSMPYFGPGLPPGVSTTSSSSSKRKHSTEQVEASSSSAVVTNEAVVKRPKFNRPTSPVRTLESRETSPNRSRSNGIIDVDSDIDDDNEDVSVNREVVDRWPKPKRARQQNLLRQGFTRAVARSPSPELMEVQSTPPSHQIQVQPSVTRHERRSWDSSESLELIVRIDLEVIELKLHGRDLKRTMGDIEDVVRRKFEARTGCRPELSFRTSDGVSLPKDLSLEELPAERNKCTLIAEITRNELVPIAERYKKVCENLNMEATDLMLKSLRVCDNTKSYRFPRDEDDSSLNPLSRCLRYQSDLRILDLSGVTLFSKGELLASIISPLQGLCELHLQCCDLDSDSLSDLEKLPAQIHVLDLSYNPLGGAHQKLHELIQPLNHLQRLRLVSCGLGDFEPKLSSNYLVALDLSHNPIGGKGAANLLQEQLVELNLGNTQDFASRKDNVIDRIFYGAQNFKFPALETLDLSSCDATDLDVETVLAQTPNLKRINLSNNLNITRTTLCALLARRPSMTLMNLSGCEFIEHPPDPNLRLASPQHCTVFVHMKTEVIDAWENLWQGRCSCRKLPHFLVHFKPR